MGTNAKQLVDFMARSLSAAQASCDTVRILCTLPERGAPAARRPQQRVRRLVVLDSSFNPPTLAHARMARTAVGEAGPGTRLLLLLAVRNADKSAQPASFPVRLAMMEAMARALQREGGFGEIDVAVTTHAFFHDKARAVAESGFYAHDGQRGGHKGAAEGPEQEYLVGFDTLVRILDPKYYNDARRGDATAAMHAALDPFFERARLRVTMRPDEDWGSREEQRAYVQGLERPGGGGALAERIQMVDADEDADGTAARVSSSRAREAVRTEGLEGLHGLVDEEVKAWIEREALYRA